MERSFFEKKCRYKSGRGISSMMTDAFARCRRFSATPEFPQILGIRNLHISVSLWNALKQCPRERILPNWCLHEKHSICGQKRFSLSAWNGQLLDRSSLPLRTHRAASTGMGPNPYNILSVAFEQTREIPLRTSK